MARKKAKEKIEEVAEQAGYPEAREFLSRLADDKHLREGLARAIETSKHAVDGLGSKRKRGKLLDDEKLHAELQDAIDAFRNATTGIAQAPAKTAKKRRHRGRKLMILVLGGGLGARWLRGPALQGARHAVRRRGGVRVRAAAATTGRTAAPCGRARATGRGRARARARSRGRGRGRGRGRACR